MRPLERRLEGDVVAGRFRGAVLEANPRRCHVAYLNAGSNGRNSDRLQANYLIERASPASGSRLSCS